MIEKTDYEKKTKPLEFLSVERLSPKPHLHPEIELIICKSGSCDAYINGKRYRLSQDSAIIVFPHQMHFYDTTENGEFALFVFYPEIAPLISEIFSKNIPTNPLIKLNENHILELNGFCTKYDCEKPYSSTLLAGYINILLSDILPKTHLCHISAERDLVDKIMHYCVENYTEAISLELLAEVFNTSISNVSHIWSKVMGMSLPQYINWLRVSSACKLLASTDRTVTRIASDVGFTTLRNFNRSFLNIMHITPTAYRNQYRL